MGCACVPAGPRPTRWERPEQADGVIFLLPSMSHAALRRLRGTHGACLHGTGKCSGPARELGTGEHAHTQPGIRDGGRWPGAVQNAVVSPLLFDTYKHCLLVVNGQGVQFAPTPAGLVTGHGLGRATHTATPLGTQSIVTAAA